MAERKVEKYLPPQDLAFPLVEPWESSTVEYAEVNSSPNDLENTARKMLKQSIFLRRLNGLSKTTCEKSRKTPAERRQNFGKLKRKYRQPQPAVFHEELAHFITSSRIIDPPPPVHDLGDFDREDLEILAQDPEVLEVLSESQLNSGPLVIPHQLEGGFHIIDLANQNDEPNPLLDEVETDDLDLLLEPEEALDLESSTPVNNQIVIVNPLEDNYDD